MNRPPQVIVGAKLPLRPMHVWAIRVRLQIECRLRDLALFDIAIDSKLRGCDVVSLRLYVARVRFEDDSLWQDNGSRSCGLKASFK